MKKNLLVIIACTLLSFACSKGSNAPTFCWECVDQEGNKVADLCDKTEEEISELTADHTPYWGCSKK